MITIRPANKDEVADLQQLNNELFIDNAKYDSDIKLGWPFSENGKKYFTFMVHSTEAICLIAEDGAKKSWLPGCLAEGDGFPKQPLYRGRKHGRHSRVSFAGYRQTARAEMLRASERTRLPKSIRPLLCKKTPKQSLFTRAMASSQLILV